MTAASAEVERRALAPGAEMFQRAQMRLGEVLDMNVVADRRPIRRRVIGSINFDLRPLPERRRQNERDEVRLRLVPFADFALGIGAGSIEIAQRHPPQPVGLTIPVERTLDRQLGLAVRVDRQLGQGLADRHLGGSAVGRASRGKDDLVDPSLAHRFEQ